MEKLNLRVWKVIFFLSLLGSFLITELFYSSSFSPDFQTYFTYIDFNFKNTNLTNNGHGHLYYYLVSSTIFIKSYMISELNISSILNSSVQLTNFILYCFGIFGIFLLLLKNNISKQTAYITLTIANFFPAAIIMRIWMKPEILAFSLLPWIVLFFDEYLEKKDTKNLIFTMLPLCLVLQTKGSIFGMISLFLFLKYINKILENTQIIKVGFAFFLFFFILLYFENFLLNDIHLFDHRAASPDDYNYKATLSFLTHINRLDFYYFPIFEYHNNSFIGITLLDAFGDYFNLSFNSDKSFFNYDKLQIGRNGLSKLYSRQYLGLAFSLTLCISLIIGALKNNKLRIYYIGPFIGMLVLALNALGVPSNNFDPTKGDTIKVHYYSFLLTLAFIFIVSKIFNSKKILPVILTVFLISSFLFLLGFPKTENSNINFYLDDKVSYTNLCPVGKLLLDSSNDCNKTISICKHNLYSENISLETLSEEKIKNISEKNQLTLVNSENELVFVSGISDCLQKLSTGYELYNPIGKSLRTPPLANLLYFIATLFGGTFLSRQFLLNFNNPVITSERNRKN